MTNKKITPKPLQFKDIPGLNNIKAALILSVKRNHVAHSQLFYGQEGGAQLALALAYATFVNCENKTDDDSCGSCASCHKMNRMIHPDFHPIFPTTKTAKVKTTDDDEKKGSSFEGFLPLWRSFLQENAYKTLPEWHEHIGAEKNQQAIIPADVARKIIQKVSMKAYEAEYKILLIWLPELMNNTAANAILKVLEEPPAKTIFLLVSNDPNKLLPTILSRTLLINISLFEDKDVVDYLVSNNLADETRATKVAYLAAGNMCKALEILTDEESDIHENFAIWMRFCFKPDIAGLIKMADQFAMMNKTTQKSLFEYSLSLFRDLFLWINGGQVLVRLEGAELQFVERFGKVINPKAIEKITKEISDTHYHLERNANPKILFLDLSFMIARVIKTT